MEVKECDELTFQPVYGLQLQSITNVPEQDPMTVPINNILCTRITCEHYIKTLT